MSIVITLIGLSVDSCKIGWTEPVEILTASAQIMAITLYGEGFEDMEAPLTISDAKTSITISDWSYAGTVEELTEEDIQELLLIYTLSGGATTWRVYTSDRGRFFIGVSSRVLGSPRAETTEGKLIVGDGRKTYRMKIIHEIMQ